MLKPKQTDPQFKLRLTPELDTAIEMAAMKNGRTKNGEILMRLDQSFARSDTDFEARVVEIIERHVRNSHRRSR